MWKLALTLFALTLGCYGTMGPQGVEGPAGPQGPEGPPGPQGATSISPALIWKNSVGTIIAYGEPPMHKDSNNDWWFVQTDLGQVDQTKQPISRIVYPSTNCTGPSFYLGPTIAAASLPRPPYFPPRLPFFVETEGQWRVRTDNARSQMIDVQSTQLTLGGPCFTTNFPNHPVLPTSASASTTTVLPDLGSTGPLHMETFQD